MVKLTLQQLTGNKYFLEVDPKDKIRKVKLKIFEELEIKQKMRLLWQNKSLEEGVTLQASGITEDTTIQMVLEPDTKIKLNIQTFKKSNVTIELNESSTSLDLVEALSTSTLQSTPEVSDFYFGKMQLSEVEWPLYFYGITDGATVVQKHSGVFNIAIEDACVCQSIGFIKVTGKDTIKNVREKIIDIINKSGCEEEVKVTEDDIVTFHSRSDRTVVTEGSRVYHELDRDTLTVFQCDIRPIVDIITIIRYHNAHNDDKASFDAMIPIKGNKYKTRKIYRVYNGESVLSVRLKIQHQLGIPFEKQVITGSWRFGCLEWYVDKDDFKTLLLEDIDGNDHQKEL